jgi:hypothetical protein
MLSSANAAETHLAKEPRDPLPVQIPGWSAVLQAAAKETSKVDAVLNEAEEAIHQWLSKAQTLTQGLAAWGEP